MTISIYRTSDAWWAGTADAVAKIDTAATTTAQLLADRAAIERAAASTETVAVKQPGSARAGNRAVPRRRADDQLRIPRRGHRR